MEITWVRLPEPASDPPLRFSDYIAARLCVTGDEGTDYIAAEVDAVEFADGRYFHQN